MGARGSKRTITQGDEENNGTVKIRDLVIPKEWVLPLFVGIGLGVVLCYLFLISQSFFINPLISNAVRASMAAQTPVSQIITIPASTNTPYPTHTPNPTFTPFPTFTPQAALPTYTPVLLAALPSA